MKMLYDFIYLCIQLFNMLTYVVRVIIICTSKFFSGKFSAINIEINAFLVCIFIKLHDVTTYFNIQQTKNLPVTKVCVMK